MDIKDLNKQLDKLLKKPSTLSLETLSEIEQEASQWHNNDFDTSEEVYLKLVVLYRKAGQLEQSLNCFRHITSYYDRHFFGKYCFTSEYSYSYGCRNMWRLTALDEALKDYLDLKGKYKPSNGEIKFLMDVSICLDSQYDKISTSILLCDSVRRVLDLCRAILAYSDDLATKQRYLHNCDRLAWAVKVETEYGGKTVDKRHDFIYDVTKDPKAVFDYLKYAESMFDLATEYQRAKINECLSKIAENPTEYLEQQKELDRLADQKQAEEFLANCSEEREGNEVIQRFRYGPTRGGRQLWIIYFYTDCTDERIIEKKCLELFGGENETDAEGYVGAYTSLEKLKEYESAYKAGYNYSFEQMEANYD